MLGNFASGLTGTLTLTTGELVVGHNVTIQGPGPKALTVSGNDASRVFHVTAGLAIYDTMQYVKPDIQTICIGQAASMAAVLLAAGKKGKRYALPNSRVVIHQPLIMGGGLAGQASEIDIHHSFPEASVNASPWPRFSSIDLQYC